MVFLILFLTFVGSADASDQAEGAVMRAVETGDQSGVEELVKNFEAAKSPEEIKDAEDQVGDAGKIVSCIVAMGIGCQILTDSPRPPGRFPPTQPPPASAPAPRPYGGTGGGAGIWMPGRGPLDNPYSPPRL